VRVESGHAAAIDVPRPEEGRGLMEIRRVYNAMGM
jgi:hypothetical protein